MSDDIIVKEFLKDVIYTDMKEIERFIFDKLIQSFETFNEPLDDFHKLFLKVLQDGKC